MAKIEHTWPIDELDAFSIRGSNVTLNIRGIDGNKILLKCTGEEKHIRTLSINRAGRWLKLHTSANTGNLKLELQLPRCKEWGVDVFSVQADFHAEDITARLNVMLGKGKILVERCRGAFATTSGNASVRLNRFVEAEIPVLEPLPKEEQKQEQETSDYKWDYEKDYWAHWSLGFGEKIARSLFGQKEGNGNNPGINMKLAKGDLLLEETEADTCVIRAANGEVNLNSGRISKLDLKLMKGNIESESCKPGDDWIIRTNRGNVFISLTGDIVARLDVATRHGEIQSKAPLVRVTRQGPEVWRGGRMVGTVGTNPKNKEKIPELNVSTLRGDIKIEKQSGAGQQVEKPESPPIPPAPPSPPTKPPAGKKADLYKTQMDILQALSEGRINIDEAERLLDNLESQDSASQNSGI